MKLRLLTVAAAMVLAATSLTACRSNVGVAAKVDGHRISESTVHGYLIDAGPTAAGLKNLTDQGGHAVPVKSVVLNYLVQSQVFSRVLTTTKGGMPSEGELTALHDKAASTLLGTTETGAQIDTDISKSFADEGLRAKFLPVLLRNLELEQAVIDRVSATTAADIVKAVATAHVSVTVNPSYGSWTPASFGVTPAGGAGTTPNYLTLTSTSAPAPAASATPAGG